MCCAHRIIQEEKKYIYNSAKRSTHANLRGEQTNTHTRTLIKKPDHKRVLYIYYYFNVFEHDRDVNRKNCKCFVNTPFLLFEYCCKCFGDIEHDELPSIDDDGDVEHDICCSCCCCEVG
jgi:hypothetical protein